MFILYIVVVAQMERYVCSEYIQKYIQNLKRQYTCICCDAALQKANGRGGNIHFHFILYIFFEKNTAEDQVN